ncbi:hypothetical protein ADK76_11245 [Streptomyces griseoflavus]|uniref:hypothetical protein n=1 Tax=Streptomyces rimosus TaxID=1927 RepID=UPI0004C76393|nr:hypothetical protein [Streptomyces rimosus]KOG63838.1 hypothetical protein ADK76_11245 [Streptomyces griseoflavus]
MVTPVIRAETWDGTTVDAPSDEKLFDLLSEMNLRHRFVIVDRLDRGQPGQYYMQVYLNDDMSCQVEYRDGGPAQHFQAHVPGPFDHRGHEVVASVLTAWAADRPGWREALDWTPRH